MNSLLRKTKLRVSLAFTLFILATGLFIFWFLASGRDLFLFLNTNNQASVSRTFVWALLKKKPDVARSLVVPEQEQKVVQWLNDQESVSCLSVESEWWGVDLTAIHIREKCLLGGYHCILVENIALTDTNTGWQILNWDTIFDSYNPTHC